MGWKDLKQQLKTALTDKQNLKDLLAEKTAEVEDLRACYTERIEKLQNEWVEKEAQLEQMKKEMKQVRAAKLSKVTKYIPKPGCNVVAHQSFAADLQTAKEEWYNFGYQACRELPMVKLAEDGEREKAFNEGLGIGKKLGHSSGLDEGKHMGYIEGLDEGKEVGHSNGLEEGRAEKEEAYRMGLQQSREGEEERYEGAWLAGSHRGAQRRA